ncbi:hypothetical protein BOX15_Mlig013902g1, partial [Macrostomum lignano]
SSPEEEVAAVRAIFPDLLAADPDADADSATTGRAVCSSRSLRLAVFLRRRRLRCCAELDAGAPGYPDSAGPGIRVRFESLDLSDRDCSTKQLEELVTSSLAASAESLAGAPAARVAEFLRRLRTERVDNDSRGRPCRERLMSVLHDESAGRRDASDASGFKTLTCCQPDSVRVEMTQHGCADWLPSVLH